MDDLFEENSIVRKLWHSISRIKKCNLLPTVTIFLKGWLWLFSPQIPTKNESNATEFVVCNLILSCLAYRHLRSKHDTKPAKTQYHDARKESQYNDTHFDCSFVSMLLLNRYLIWRSLILVKYRLNEKKKKFVWNSPSFILQSADKPPLMEGECVALQYQSGFYPRELLSVLFQDTTPSALFTSHSSWTEELSLQLIAALNCGCTMCQSTSGN